MQKTKIICTLGPKCDSKTELIRMIQAGMDMARLNMSHGSYEHHEKMIHNLHKAGRNLGKKIPFFADLQGPKIRLGKLPERGITLKRGQIITLTTDHRPPTTNNYDKIPVQYHALPEEVTVGHSILIDDGLIELEVISKTKTDIKCKVIVAGKISSNKGLNLPDTNLKHIKTITEKDRNDIEFAVKFHPSYIALSFVKDAKDIEHLKKLISESPIANRQSPKIIAKIECQQAMKNLEGIVKASDMIMVARGDLGVEIGDEKVPLAQRKIIEMSKKYKKPVIVATQMMSSMIDNARPTRAEASDIARAVWEGADYTMLSNETSVGKYAVKAVQMMEKIIRECSL